MKSKLNYEKNNRNINKRKSNKRPLIFSVNNRDASAKILQPSYSVNKTRKMNWKQLKKKFPKMDPYADADFDGLVNARDCKPLDPSKDGAFSRFIGVVTGGKKGQSAAEYKAERVAKGLVKQIASREKAKAAAAKKAKRIVKGSGYISKERVKRIERVERFKQPFQSKTAEAIEGAVSRIAPTTRREAIAAAARRRTGIVKAVEKFAGVSGTTTKAKKAAKGQAQDGAGRPKQSYKYKDPRTGQPISAVEYHKLRKQLKKEAKTVETKTEIQQRFALAKRGLSPEEVTAAQEEINARMARLRAIKEAKQITSEEAEVGVPSPEMIEERIYQQEIPEPQIQQFPTRRIRPMAQAPTSHGIPPGYKLQEDLMTGRKTLVAEPQREAWTR